MTYLMVLLHSLVECLWIENTRCHGRQNITLKPFVTTLFFPQRILVGLCLDWEVFLVKKRQKQNDMVAQKALPHKIDQS
jgi:hypothetical protein